ncbi:predicted protein [Histoplasma capsulatum var. duboisii H88]|uniref:Predicted protein n=1 Tax=Ajellomyces capsulatus (strain H88) TaxID=544711 RepID=F0UPG1_AJEC8|nr:predicted protein [Histoplasma capsulatum var. duboisii H88]
MGGSSPRRRRSTNANNQLAWETPAILSLNLPLCPAAPPPRRPQRMSLLEGECKAGENPISKDSISYQETDSRGRVVVVASQDGSGVCGAQGSASRSRVDTTQGTPPKSNFHNDGLQPSPFCFSLQPAAQQELRP